MTTLMRGPSAFRRELLPCVRNFYAKELGKLSRPSRGWSRGRCPFHNSKSGLSFSVNLDSGAFHCFGCDVHGGDVVSFLRQRDGLGFKEACQQLGCWDVAGKPVKVRPGPPIRYLAMDFVVAGIQHRASVRDEPRDYADKIRRFYREASDRLTELSHGDSERYAGEQENCWARMACALDELREMENL